MSKTKNSYQRLNAFMAKSDSQNARFQDLLAPRCYVESYNINSKYNFDGILFVKKTSEKRPRWGDLVNNIAEKPVAEIGNKSSSAVLFLRTQKSLFAFTFGYGRSLIDLMAFVPDFGIKTALNTLDHQNLRSIDLHTLDDQPVQKKAQAARETDISVFGIDISRDVLRAVTGSPKTGIEFRNISGGDAVYSFGHELNISELPALADRLSSYYKNDDYKNQFSWVDNIRKVKGKSQIDILDNKLVAAIKDNDSSLAITIPEILEWDSVLGFSFTRSKKDIQAEINKDAYIEKIDRKNISIKSIKTDRLFVFDVHDHETKISMYKCFYFEIVDGNRTHLLFGGTWYEIDNTFMSQVQSVLKRIEISDLVFPPVHSWLESEKKKIEKEKDYNRRASEEFGYYLLDCKLIKSNKTTSPIELCDLLTSDKHFIHVKHRKGGSAGLSHLFAQGRVSAEIMLGDRDFRKEARKALKKVSPEAMDLITLDRLNSSEFEIVFLILGDSKDTVKNHLPFFSKVNLARSFEDLTQRGFHVTISGVEKVNIEAPEISA